jgi:hypothetical protein
MKRVLFFVVPFALALVLSAARADDTEVKATVGCQHCNFSAETGATSCGAAAKVGDKVYVLKGDKVSKDFKKGGEWTIKGKVDEKAKTIEVTEMKKA